MIRSIDRWLLPVLKHRKLKRRPMELNLAICDHFEPLHDTDLAGALLRISQWHARYPSAVEGVRDSAGRGPRHTFFYPIEQNHPEILAALARLVEAVGGEVEVHLHHRDDTAAGLDRALRVGMDEFERYGFLGRDHTGATRFGFIHGNWALDHSDPRGVNCGVPDELGVLRRAGCYADFTMPSAPHPTQVPTVNALYYAEDGPEPCSHAKGSRVRVRAGEEAGFSESERHLLCVQGPLLLNWTTRKYGLLPKIENADLTGKNPPTLTRAKLWAAAGVSVAGADDRVFVKLHTHGAIPANSGMFLGGAFREFLEDLVAWCEADEPVRLRFVSAREMVNRIHAIESGSLDDSEQALDYPIACPSVGGRR